MNKTSAKLLLSCVFIARGTSFLFSKTLLTTMSSMGILAVRFCLAFVILSVIFHRRLFHAAQDSLRGGMLLGVLYTVCMIFEMQGLKRIDSGVSALIENMAIVLVPLYASMLTRTKPSSKTMLCALLAVAGVACLSITQTSHAGSGLGIFFMICAAMTYGLCILMTERVTRKADPITAGVIQMGTMGFLCLAAALVTGSFTLPSTESEWSMLLMLVLVCSCFGFTFQPLGQKYVPAETAAVFTVLNPLTASLMGILIAGEALSPLKGIGYVLILSALLIYNIRAASTGGKSQKLHEQKKKHFSA